MMSEARVSLRRGNHALDVQLPIAEAGVTALFGASGSGKSSTLDAIAGLILPDQGLIRIGGEVLYDSATGINVPVEQRRIGYVFQDLRLFPHLSVRGNLDYGRKRRAGTTDFDSIIDLLGIGGLLDRRPATLSGGERQRVAIGRALLSGPRLLLMDEPLAALDAARRAEILPFLDRMKHELKLPILYVSHNIEEVVRIADSIALIDQGRIVASGPLAEVMAHSEMTKVLGPYDAGSVIEGVVESFDARLDVSRVRFADGVVVTGGRAGDLGATVRIRVRARDVALAVTDPDAISIANRLQGVIETLTPQGTGGILVIVAIGGTRLHSLITRDAVDRLALAPGMRVTTLFKAVALQG